MKLNHAFIKVALLNLFALSSGTVFASGNSASEEARMHLAAAQENLQSCISVLEKAGENPKLNALLDELNPNTATEMLDKAAIFKKVEKAFGKPVDLTADQLVMCHEVVNSQLKLQSAANQQPAVSLTGQANELGCGSGMSYCPNPSSSGGVCCTSADVCASACGPEGGNCYAYCEHKICFPSSASVLLEDGSRKLMSQLQIGDRVQVVQADGSLAFEDIYLMTHNDHESQSEYLQLTLASGQVMTLSPRHFIPTAENMDSAWGSHLVIGANELQVGDIVWYQESNGKMYASVVEGINSIIEQGAFNPLTASGTIVVDGVIASAHSDWFLDGIASADTQAAVYQAMFAPVRLIYALIGPEAMKTVTVEWGVVDFVRDQTATASKTIVFLTCLMIVLYGMFFSAKVTIRFFRKQVVGLRNKQSEEMTLERQA